MKEMEKSMGQWSLLAPGFGNAVCRHSLPAGGRLDFLRRGGVGGGGVEGGAPGGCGEGVGRGSVGVGSPPERALYAVEGGSTCCGASGWSPTAMVVCRRATTGARGGDKRPRGSCSSAESRWMGRASILVELRGSLGGASRSRQQASEVECSSDAAHRRRDEWITACQALRF